MKSPRLQHLLGRLREAALVAIERGQREEAREPGEDTDQQKRSQGAAMDLRDKNVSHAPLADTLRLKPVSASAAPV